MSRHEKFCINSLALVLSLAVATVAAHAQGPAQQTTTPIKHVVVIFQENVSFDHYFGTYPIAANPANEPRFIPKQNTPSVNNLLSGGLIGQNPNSTQPFRLDRSRAATCDQDHDYKDEQLAYNAGLANKFVETVGTGPGTSGNIVCNKSDVMGYYDGNTVTAFWNYAQRFAISDNSFNTTYGPSTPGALNLISGQTHGAVGVKGNTSGDLADGSVIGDPQPAYDNCSTRETVSLSGKNVGDLLNAAGVTWGWFQGGFRDCKASHIGSNGLPKGDYIPHHEPFQYYQSTSNPNHLPPSSVSAIGSTDQANHQYDLVDFWSAMNNGNMPAVSFLKAAGYQDGHAGYSDPLAEQQFVVDTINKLQRTKEWKDTAVIIAYDDSDGWYDHVMPPVVNQSNTTEDALTGPNSCGTATVGTYQGRCGYGPRLPLLVISPYANINYVDHSITDQSSILRFVEDNWNLGRIGDQSFDERAGSLTPFFDFNRGPATPRLILDPVTGQKTDDSSIE